MKKWLILFLLSFLLLGCNATKDEIVKTLENDIEVCDEDCETDISLFEGYYNDYITNLDSNPLLVVKEGYTELIQLDTGETYTKQDIPRFDLLGTNMDIPVSYPADYFQYLLQQIEEIGYSCSLGTPCTGFFIDVFTTLTSIEYGFTENNGYYKVSGTSSLYGDGITEFKYAISSDSLTYENSYYFPQSENFRYTIYEDGIYRRYEYQSESQYEFTYMNMNNYNYIKYHHNESIEDLDYFDQRTQLLYNMTDSKEFSVTKYNNMEYVSELIKNDDGYVSAFNIFYLDGWDSFTYRSESKAPYSMLLYNDEEVFADLDILIYRQVSNFFIANVIVRMDNLEDYSYPSEFNSDPTFEQMKITLNDFMNMEIPLDISGITSKSIFDKSIELLNAFQEKYQVIDE